MEFKELTEKQTNNIHKRGYVTSQEIFSEWEALGLCAPCNSKGPKNKKCDEYNNCHDCLVHFANQKDEWISMYQFMMLLNDQPLFNISDVVNPKVLTKKKDK